MGDVTLNVTVLIGAIASLSSVVVYLFNALQAAHQKEIERIVTAKDEHIRREREVSDYYRVVTFEVLRKAEGAVQIADRATSLAERRP